MKLDSLARSLFACLSLAALGGCSAAPAAGAPADGSAPSCESLTVTPDCASEDICETLGCLDEACTLCPQVVRADGTPTRWAAYSGHDACECPEPRVETSPACERPTATLDIPTREMAEAVCVPGPCHVCVQRVDADGEPITWAAVYTPEECGCSEPERVSVCEAPDVADCGSEESCRTFVCAGRTDCVVCPFRIGELGTVDRWAAYFGDADCVCPELP